MASILRSSKFVRYFASLARSIVINQPREVDGTLIQRSQILANCVQKDFATLASPAVENKGSRVDRSIKRLDQDVRRNGRVSRTELLGIIDDIRSSRHATSTQSLMVIRCCGNLVPEEVPEVRTKLVQDVWNTFENIGVVMDISHYNALLRVYLENEHNFSPSEFLSELEKKGVEPNRVTFQRLIATYCQQGDIEGATRILEFMKNKKMPVNEGVFNALIMGHSQADDMESAMGIMGVMKQANIEPSSDTYISLICGYAKRGDINSIKKVIEESEAQGISLADKDYLEIVYTLGVNGHLDHISEILGKTPKLFGFNQDAKNVALRLIAKGEDKAAVLVLKSMTPVLGPNGEPVLVGSFLLKQMVKTNRPFETIISLCTELQDSKENEKALLVATEASLVYNKSDLSIKLLSALAKQEQVCQHYYWPVIIHFGKANNRQGVLNVLKQMSLDMGHPVAGETLRDYVVQYLSDGEAGVHELRQAGISLASAASAMVYKCLVNKNMKAAARLGLQFKANYSSNFIRRTLVGAFIAEPDVDSLVTMVQLMEEGNTKEAAEEEDDGIEPAGQILLVIASILRKERVALFTQILKKYLENGIGISNSTAHLLQSKLTGDELTAEISTLLTKLTSPDLIPTALNRPPPNRLMKIKDENALLNSISIVQAKGESTKGLKRQLLTLYCHNRELEKGIKLKKEMDADGFDFQSGMLSLMMDLHSSNEMLPEAWDYYKQVLANDPDAQIDESKTVRLANLLIKNDRTADAIELFKVKNVKEETHERGFSYTSSCWKLLNCLAEMGDAENLNTIFNLMKSNGYIEPSNVLLGPLIKVHLLKDDIKGALDKFEECCSKYNATPWKNEIACKLIQSENAMSLQRLTDLSTQIHGEVNSLYDLVLSFVECGRIRQARKILETPGLRLRSQRINAACERYSNEGRVNHLENLIQATKDISHIDRAEIYQHLLSSYNKSNEVEKALGLWTQMQDEDVQPTEEFLLMLSELLKNNGKPIPFTVPDIQIAEEKTIEEKDMSQKKKTNPVQAQLKGLRRAMFNKDIEEAIRIKESLKESDLQMSDRSALLNVLVNSGRLGEATRMLVGWLENNLRPNIKSLNFTINNIAKVGDIDSFNAIGKLLNDDMKKMVSFVNRQTHCMVEAGRAKEVLNMMEADIDSANTAQEISELTDRFPRGGAFSIFQLEPDLVSEFERIAEKFRKKGILEPINILWVHHTVQDNKAKASELWEHLKSTERLMFQPIMKQGREKKDLAILEDLLNNCKNSKVNAPALGIIYSCILDVMLLQGKVNIASDKLDEALKACTLSDIKRSTLIQLKQALEQNNNQFKYTIPPKNTRAEDPSSSSSSDSDNEGSKNLK